MLFDVTIYCPDTHILYEATLPDKQGVGGGLMARLRLAQALARQGHRVTIIANVISFHRHRGVEYIPLKSANQKRKTDILILTSSGGALSLEPALDLQVDAKLALVWVHGVAQVHALEKLHFDHIISVSNFLCNVIRQEWHSIEQPLFVIYNGFPKQDFSPIPVHRDSFCLIYASHPDKGLDAALKVLQKVRRHDDRFHLRVLGGDALYGGRDTSLPKQSGVSIEGTHGQTTVMRALQGASFSIQLQSRPEPFGMVLTEAMSRGAIPIASPVGAYSELIRNGENGILVPGGHHSEETQEVAAEWILRLNRDPQLAAYIRRNAMNIPWDWDTMAKVWTGYWEWIVHRKGALLPDRRRCTRCDGGLLALADGYHCIECGWYYQNLSAAR